MKTICIRFYECEHDGDLENYISDITASGGEVKDSDINIEAETGEVQVTVKDLDKFVEEFIKTESCGFSNYSHYQTN